MLLFSLTTPDSEQFDAAVDEAADTACEGGSSGTIVFASTPGTDRIVVLIAYDQSTPTFTVNTSGFTQIIVQTNGNKKIQAWRKKVDGVENSFQVSNSGGTSVGRLVGLVLDVDDTEDEELGETYSGTSVASGPITTTVADCVVVSAFVQHFGVSSLSNSDSFTIQADVDRGGVGIKVLTATAQCREPGKPHGRF